MKFTKSLLVSVAFAALAAVAVAGPGVQYWLKDPKAAEPAPKACPCACCMKGACTMRG